MCFNVIPLFGKVYIYLVAPQLIIIRILCQNRVRV